MAKIKVSADVKKAISGGAWDYDQIVMLVQAVRDEAGNAWDWMVPRVREALIAERAFQIIRGSHRAEERMVTVRDMDHLLNSMLIVAGLTTLEDLGGSP